MGARAKYEISAPLKEAQERLNSGGVPDWPSADTGIVMGAGIGVARQYGVFVRPRCCGSTTPS